MKSSPVHGEVVASDALAAWPTLALDPAADGPLLPFKDRCRTHNVVVGWDGAKPGQEGSCSV